jgi:hypothetical protein
MNSQFARSYRRALIDQELDHVFTEGLGGVERGAAVGVRGVHVGAKLDGALRPRALGLPLAAAPSTHAVPPHPRRRHQRRRRSRAAWRLPRGYRRGGQRRIGAVLDQQPHDRWSAKRRPAMRRRADQLRAKWKSFEERRVASRSAAARSDRRRAR